MIPSCCWDFYCFHCTEVWWAVNNLVCLGTTLPKIKPFTFTFACGRWSFQRNLQNSKKMRLQSFFSMSIGLDSLGLIIVLFFLYSPSLHFRANIFIKAFSFLSHAPSLSFLLDCDKNPRIYMLYFGLISKNSHSCTWW